MNSPKLPYFLPPSAGSSLQRRDVRPAVFPLAASLPPPSLIQCNSSDFAGGGFSASSNKQLIW